MDKIKWLLNENQILNKKNLTIFDALYISIEANLSA